MKLGKYWTGDWPWSHSDGVGLKLTGYPKDENAFRSFMYGASCNPVAVERILKELKENGFKLTTVQASLNFAHIGDELARLGIKMEVVEPVAYEKINDTTIDYAVLCIKLGKPMPDYLTPEQALEVSQRADDTPPLERAQLGPYSSI